MKKEISEVVVRKERLKSKEQSREHSDLGTWNRRESEGGGGEKEDTLAKSKRHVG